MQIRGVDARDLAVRIAGANHSRRLYRSAGNAWERTLEALGRELERWFEAGTFDEITVALIGEGLAVMGVPIGEPPTSVLRLMAQLRQRDVEIIAIRRGFATSELDALFSYLGADAADVAGMRADGWLRERGVDNIRIKHLSLMHGSGVESFRDVYWRSKRVLGREFERAAERGNVHLGAVGELANALMSVILEADAPIATLLALRDRDDYALVHSVNVATLVGAQAGGMPLPVEDVERMVSAALVHDIGKTRVPDAILQKGGRLTPQEREILDRHTIEGAKLLADASGKDSLPMIVALEHHSPPPPDSPGLLVVELVRIADVFDGIRTLWPFDDRAGMRAAIGFMAGRLRERFNDYLLERFARMVGAFEVGETAWLDTGEVGKVLETHPELAFHPRVEIVERRDGRIDAGKKIDLGAYAHDPRCPRAFPPVPEGLGALDEDAIDDLG